MSMTGHDHLARLEAEARDSICASSRMEAIAWAVKTIREQAEEVKRLRARVAELERLNDAAVRSMVFAKEAMDMGTETIKRLLAEKGDAK